MVMLRRLVHVGSEYQISTNSWIDAASLLAIASATGFRSNDLILANAAGRLEASPWAISRARSSSASGLGIDEEIAVEGGEARQVVRERASRIGEELWDVEAEREELPLPGEHNGTDFGIALQGTERRRQLLDDNGVMRALIRCTAMLGRPPLRE